MFCHNAYAIFIFLLTFMDVRHGRKRVDHRGMRKRIAGDFSISEEKINVYNSPATKKAVVLSGGELYDFSKSERTIPKRMKFRRKM